MKNFTVTVNGVPYAVSVEETGAAAPAVAAAPAAAPVAAAVAPGQAWNSLGLEWPERGPGGAPACGRQQSTPGRRQRLLYLLGYYSDACTGEARTHACLAACIFIAANII